MDSLFPWRCPTWMPIANASNIWAVPATGGAAIQTDAERPRFRSGMVAGQQNASIYFFARRKFCFHVLSMEGGESHAIIISRAG